MFFKNLITYKINGDIDTNALLGIDLAFRKCGESELATTGWAHPFINDSKQLLHKQENIISMCMQREEKIIPKNYIERELNKDIATVEATGQKVGKKLKAEMRDEVIFRLLPKAFSNITQTHAFIDLGQQLLFIDTSSKGRAEELITLLHKSVQLSIVPLATNKLPNDVLTQLVSGDLKLFFDVTNNCQMNVYDGMVKFKNQDLWCNEVQELISNGGIVTSLSGEWSGYISFTINDDLSLKGLKFIGLDVFPDTQEDQMSGLQLTSGVLGQFIEELIAAMGGLVNED